MTLDPLSEGTPLRTLADLVPGARALIVRLDGEPAVSRRLMELGLVPGAELVLVRTAPLGDPIEVAVDGVHLTLRRSEGRTIHVKPSH